MSSGDPKGAAILIINDYPETYAPHSRITNSILYGNTGAAQTKVEGTTAIVSYSDIEGGVEGTGNVDSDPLFTDANGTDNTAGNLDDNLRLANNSPLIDAGNNDALPADIFDLNDNHNTGEPWPLDYDNYPRQTDFIE